MASQAPTNEIKITYNGATYSAYGEAPVAIPDRIIIEFLIAQGAIKNDREHPMWVFDSRGYLNSYDRTASGRISSRVPQDGWRPVRIEGYTYRASSACGRMYWMFVRG